MYNNVHNFYINVQCTIMYTTWVGTIVVTMLGYRLGFVAI